MTDEICSKCGKIHGCEFYAEIDKQSRELSALVEKLKKSYDAAIKEAKQPNGYEQAGRKIIEDLENIEN